VAKLSDIEQYLNKFN